MGSSDVDSELDLRGGQKRRVKENSHKETQNIEKTFVTFVAISGYFFYFFYSSSSSFFSLPALPCLPFSFSARSAFFTSSSLPSNSMIAKSAPSPFRFPSLMMRLYPPFRSAKRGAMLSNTFFATASRRRYACSWRRA